ncbi:MAG: N-acetyl sugar amidotransferase [Pseudomonadota bacterium]
MKYCKNCVMPDTRPGIIFNEDGICSACVNYEKIKTTDWGKRKKELEALCDKYRGMNGDGYDCMIAVSGGKDSHFQVYIMKEVMKMNPLLVTVEDNFTVTEAGKSNIRNISEEFGCNIISYKPNIKLQKLLMRKTFEKYLKPTWYLDRLIYTYPLHMAAKFNTPLLVYGENVSYAYGGRDDKETYSAKEQVNNGVAADISKEELVDGAITMKDLALLEPPTREELDKLEPIYLSYFVPWNSYDNYLFAKKRGFKDVGHEWQREHTFEHFDQIDTMGYLVHAWLKYPKFGHACATDYAARFVRYSLHDRKTAVELVKKHDHKLDPLALQDFLNFTGYSAREFWDVLEKFWNRDIFEKVGTEWKLKKPLS